MTRPFSCNRLTGLFFVSLLLVWSGLVLFSAGCRAHDQETPARTASIPVYTYRVLNTYPHDARAFTQGLQFYDGHLYESTGIRGQSGLRKVDLETGRVLRRVDIPQRYFGEGIAIRDDRIYMLTWQSGTGFVFERDSFRLLDQFSYEGEGWGLAFDGTHLIMSDGTDRLRFLDPDHFDVVRTLAIEVDGKPLHHMNELALIDGELWANIWKTERVAVINLEAGTVRAWIDLRGLKERLNTRQPIDVLNGIAHDPATGRVFVTGKLWPKLFEIERTAP